MPNFWCNACFFACLFSNLIQLPAAKKQCKHQASQQMFCSYFVAALENISPHFTNQPRPAKIFASSLAKFFFFSPFLFQLFLLPYSLALLYVMIYQKIDITHPSFREIFLNDCSFEYSQLSSAVGCRTNTRKYNF